MNREWRRRERHRSADRTIPVVAVTLGVSVVALVALATAVTGVPPETFSRDLSAVAGVAWYAGAVSILNLVLWGVAGALAAFVAALHRRHRVALLLFAALSVALLADDALLLHEVVGPRLRVPELLFFVVYGMAAAVLALLLTPTRAGAAGWAILGSGALLAGSIATDLVVTGSFVIEDGLKLVGTALWVTVPLLAHLHAERLERTAPEGPGTSRHLPAAPVSAVDLREAPSLDADVPARTRAAR